MSTPSSGTISLLDIANHYGVTSGSRSLGQFRGNIGKSGQVNMTDFYGLNNYPQLTAGYDDFTGAGYNVRTTYNAFGADIGSVSKTLYLPNGARCVGIKSFANGENYQLDLIKDTYQQGNNGWSRLEIYSSSGSLLYAVNRSSMSYSNGSYDDKCGYDADEWAVNSGAFRLVDGVTYGINIT